MHAKPRNRFDNGRNLRRRKSTPSAEAPDHFKKGNFCALQGEATSYYTPDAILVRQSYRADLALMYFPSFDVATVQLKRFALTPTQIRRFRVNHTPNDGTRVEREDDSFVLRCE